ncbi:NAD(P)/FAD-dependent oxidoreductase [Halocynthiibacter sp.]|uniref:NAD(P)/FAD-dependent oxidoreductase n=1 Tax=Halocynthiibacter sp. TaxID=1979210 RepID=UPI003C36A475
MKKITVAGGGVVGMSCALSLQAAGHDVTVIDPGPIGEGASWASCGCIAVGEIVPLSQPGMLMKVPGWLINPKAPLSLRPSSALRLLPWFTRFTLNSLPSRMRAIAADLATLTFASTADFKTQLQDIGAPDLLIERPVIKLFDNDHDKATMGAAFGLARELGCKIDDISGQDAHDMDPAIAPNFQHASILHDWSFVTDPVLLIQKLQQTFLQRGGRCISQAVTNFKREDQRVMAVLCTDGTEIQTDEVVIAAGVASKRLGKILNVPLQMEGLMGYATLLGDSNSDLKHTVFYPSGGFGITPYSCGLAVAGTIEFAGENAAPDWRRADVLVERAQRVLPGLCTDQRERRMGRRPFTPDTRPVIGRTPRLKNVIFATGHGQLGLTLGATTGRIVSDIVAGVPSEEDISMFSPSRFDPAHRDPALRL